MEPRRPSEEILVKVHSLKGEKGKIAAIDPETGEYFLGKTLLEAVAKGREKHPGKVFYTVRVGSPFAHQLKGATKQ